MPPCAAMALSSRSFISAPVARGGSLLCTARRASPRLYGGSEWLKLIADAAIMRVRRDLLGRRGRGLRNMRGVTALSALAGRLQFAGPAPSRSGLADESGNHRASVVVGGVR